MPSAGALLESVAPDARFITFHVTDGDSSRWPTNTRPPLTSAREVNWHRKMTMDEKYARRWRNLIGQGIAKLMDKPDKEKHCLQCFPEGYWLFDHNKGPIANIRHDLYLHGSKTVIRFRSPAEFIPHGYWLLTDPTLNNQNCGCKYCGGGGKKTQTEISEALGLPTNRGPTSVTGTGTGLRNDRRRPGLRLSGRGSNAAASVGSWVPKESRAPREMDSEWRTMSLELNLVSSTTRTSDLRSNRLFRLGELVWCQWHAEAPHTEKGKGIDQGPRLWPAIIIDYGLDISVECSLPFGLNGSDSIIQRRKYVLRRLGTASMGPNMEYECTLAENEILPWHAHKLDRSSVSSSKFGCSRPDNVLVSFAFALETAENLVKVWAVCDRLPIKVPLSTPNAVTENLMDSSSTVSPVTPPLSSKTVESPPVSSRSTPPSSIAYSVDTTPPQRSPARLVPPSATRIRIVNDTGDVRTSTSSSSTANAFFSRRVHELRDRQPRVAIVTETRYQGLWYGAERIWTGDLVRLSPERQAFSKSLQLSLKTHDDKTWKHRIFPSPGAEMRGVLMRIDKIFARIGESGTKECTVAGPLYEIAPANWIDPAEESTSTMSSWQSCIDKPAGTHEPTYPWNSAERPPPPRDNKESRQNNLLDIPTLISPATSPGFSLRPLLPAGFELPVPVSYIAGRYYPEILKSSLLDPILLNISKPVRAPSDFLSTDWRGVELLSLCALAPGRYNCAVCVHVRLASRTGMLQEAVRVAEAERHEAKNVESGMQGDAMDLD